MSLNKTVLIFSIDADAKRLNRIKAIHEIAIGTCTATSRMVQLSPKKCRIERDWDHTDGLRRMAG